MTRWIEFAYDRMIPKGDKTCHWTVRKKSICAATNESALEILKKRFAIGEISEEEYKRMKAVIEQRSCSN